VQTRSEAITNAKKMIQVHFALAIKYKQRTDGFVLQNFEKLRSQELGLVSLVSAQFKDQILSFWHLTGGADPNQIHSSTALLLDVLSRQSYLRAQCIEGNASGLHYLRGTFDNTRLQNDLDLHSLSVLLQVRTRDMPEFIRTLKRKLVEIYTNGRDSTKTVD